MDLAQEARPSCTGNRCLQGDLLVVVLNCATRDEIVSFRMIFASGRRDCHWPSSCAKLNGESRHQLQVHEGHNYHQKSPDEHGTLLVVAAENPNVVEK